MHLLNKVLPKLQSYILPLSRTHKEETQDDSNQGKEVMNNFNVNNLVCNTKKLKENLLQ